MVDFTEQELLAICNWAMEKSDKANRDGLRYSEFYTIPHSIFVKANSAYGEKLKERQA